MVQSVVPNAAIFTDLADGTIHVALTALHPDHLDSDPTAADPTDAAGPVTQGLGATQHDASSPDLG